ncbi:dnaJ homolog subfamily C member 17 [Ixodes scapularis]|uniref:dnaJ homolog subfamily C member 17 n=1 Tax=Ixodes scapularis TaxID=6945 RepID=UPI001C3824F0|nr:dnaJ homolog subfamily C member 17 [Ixodes scapularis]
MDALMKTDLYELLQISIDADEKEIKSAYRKKALTCHPDKNPDNPKAAELFQELSRALEILTDKEARAAYDKVLKARQAAKLRNLVLDSKRRKLKEDLEAREQAALNKKVDDIDAAKQLQKEIERLRKEGSTQLEEQRELLRKQVAEELRLSAEKKQKDADWLPRLKVKWKTAKSSTADDSPAYTEESLREIFSKYGIVTCLIVSSKKKGSALLEYESAPSAHLAVKLETGNEDCPLVVSYVQEPPLPTAPKPAPGAAPASAPSLHNPERDYESLVLMKLRQAEERKRLSEQLAAEDT